MTIIPMFTGHYQYKDSAFKNAKDNRGTQIYHNGIQQLEHKLYVSTARLQCKCIWRLIEICIFYFYSQATINIKILPSRMPNGKEKPQSLELKIGELLKHG
jgi:hypothetical protein